MYHQIQEGLSNKLIYSILIAIIAVMLSLLIF